jgi:hypothetical protein
MNGTKKPSRKRRAHEKVASLPSAILLGVAVALGVGVPLLLIFTLFLYRTADPAALSAVLSLVALYAGCAAGGFSAMRKMLSSSGYTACAIAALAISTLALSVTLICKASGTSFVATVGYYAGIFAAFFAGAFLGRRRNSHPKHRRKK